MVQAFQVAPGPIYKAQKPVRNPLYRRWIKRFPCVACGSTRNVDPMRTGPHGLGTVEPEAKEDSMITTCRQCGSHYEVDRGEDGYPDAVPGENCADPECGGRLCPFCLDHFSFECDGCGHRFCDEHKTEVPDGTDRPLRLCFSCVSWARMPEIPKLEPITQVIATIHIPEWNDVA